MLRQQSALRQVSRSLADGATRTTRRTFISRRAGRRSSRPVEDLDVSRLSQKARDYGRNRQIFLWSGAVAGVCSFVYTAYKLKQEMAKPVRCDSSLPSTDPLSSAEVAERKVVLHDEQGREIVPTGNTTVPTFPRTIDLPAYSSPMSAAQSSSSSSSSSSSPDSPSPALSLGPATTEYTLVGLGARTVTFVGIQVYVVGYYVATADIASLQSALVRKVDPIATTLVPGERDQLRTKLLDPTEGEQIWDELLANGIPARSAFRVIPVRDTDFHHLRDGFVRAIQAKAHAQDDAFGEAMRDFRGIFNRGSVPKRKELLLVRDEKGKLSVAYDDGGKGGKKDGRPVGGRQLIGVVDDERVSRALWLNYLAGKKVASEPARKSIVEGIMEFVERPVGTVATQVL